MERSSQANAQSRAAPRADRAPELDPLVEEAQRRGYLTLDGTQITYHSRRRFRTSFADPEEHVRARTYAFLVINKSYSPARIDFEVRVPRRTPNDYADIVVYRDEECRDPYLVVENAQIGCTAAGFRQKIEQGYGNANSLRAPYMLTDVGRESVLFDVQNFPAGERRQNRLGSREAIPENYGEASRFVLVAQGDTDINPLDARALEMRVRRAHGLIWAGGKRDPLKAFEEWSKLLFAKIYDERNTPNGRPRRFQCGVGETSTLTANRIRDLFREACEADPSIFPHPHLDLPDEKIADVVGVIQEVALSIMPIDALGHAFEHFFSSLFRGGLGQYFTRRELVRFMVALIRPTDRDFVIDPTAGSGGFLLEALMQVWRYIDVNYAGQPDQERRKYDFAHEHLFGVEINEVVGRICKTNLVLHKDGHTNIEADRTALDSEFDNPQLRPDGSLFTVAIGNPPFGDQVTEGNRDTLGSNSLETFELGQGQRSVQSEIMVLERAFQFLRPGGRLGMVVPDGLLNNPGERSSCPAFRRYLLRTARIDAIVSLPDHAFRKSGAQNKTSLLFATKYSADEKRDLERDLADELERVEAEIVEPLDASENDDDEGGAIPADILREMQLEQRALARVIARRDYTIFLGEADQIGYSPAGATIDANDLYTLDVEGYPDPSHETTILGQYFSYVEDPIAYEGVRTPECMKITAAGLFVSHPTYRMDPKFHLFERERLHAPPAGMRMVRLGDVLRRRREGLQPGEYPDQEFLVPTLTQEGELTPREAGLGNNPPAWFGQYFTEGPTWYRVREGDLLYSRIDLWKGCVTVIPGDFDGAIVTQEFPVYEIDHEQLDPHYLKLVLRSPYFQRAIRAITTGHSNRRRTQESDFENLTIFVPQDVDTQRRVSEAVRRSERAISTTTREYRKLLSQVDELILGEIEAADLLNAVAASAAI